MRKEGYEAALKKHGLQVDEDLIISGLLDAEEGSQKVHELMNLPEPPDAIFSANDTVAVRAILELKKMGFKIPKDISIIGFNDDPIASIVEPQLTTIYHPALDIGRAAANQVLTRINSKEKVKPENIVLPTRILLRGSTREL